MLMASCLILTTQLFFTVPLQYMINPLDKGVLWSSINFDWPVKSSQYYPNVIKIILQFLVSCENILNWGYWFYRLSFC